MILGKVVGVVWGTKKSEPITGYKIVMVKPATMPVQELVKSNAEISMTDSAAERYLSNDVLLAVDCLHAAIGDYVITGTGTRVRDITLDDKVPTKTIVLGIVDDAKVYPLKKKSK